MSDKYTKYFIALFSIILALFFIRLFSGPEDLWICKKNIWVKHGNPEASKPWTSCVGDREAVVRINGINIPVRLAQTQDEIIRGLSNTDSLLENQGMLFIFENTGKHVFWMPDMKYSLDIIWIDENMKIVDIKEDVPPLIDKSKPIYYEPISPAKYVLEVNAGFVEGNNISISDTIDF